MGRAAEGCWAVTAVNCWRASCWEGESCERSASELELELELAMVLCASVLCAVLCAVLCGLWLLNGACEQ